MSESREYVYRHRRTGEILVSSEKIDDPEFELMFEIEVKPYGGRRAAGSADTRGAAEA